MSESSKITAEDLTKLIRSQGKPLPENYQEEVLKRIREREFKRDMEENYKEEKNNDHEPER